MPQDPFPSPECDGQEPDGSVPPSAEGTGQHADHQWDDDRDRDGDAGAQQGLFVCLPAEELDVARFVQDGKSDAMSPGPLLASVVHALTGDDGDGLAALSDDQLMGIISAARRMESRAAWTLMAAVCEFAARRPADEDKVSSTRRKTPPIGSAEFAADELAGELHLTWQSAAGQIEFSCNVAERLPVTFAALAEGRVHPVHVRIIEDETSVLSAADAAAADEILAGKAGSLTFGQLRSYAHRLVLELDPDAARRRKDAAKQDAHVRRFREDSGNAGMVARELPCDEVLASWQHVEQRALDLRAAGMPGTLQELRVRAYLDLLQERDSRLLPTGLATNQAGPPGGEDLPNGGPRDGEDGPGETGPGETGPDGKGPGGPRDDGNGPGGNGGSGPSPADAPEGTGGNSRARPGSAGAGGPSVAALVNITVPWSAAVGQSEAPGDAAGFGLLDAQSARDLVAAAARNPRTRWCVTAVHPDGTAAAHGCAPGRHAAPVQGQHAADYLRTLGITLNMIIRGPCNHAGAERRYRPGRALQHMVNARNTRCTAPGCGQPAARCDLDHTYPWDHGGLTCPCNLAPLCRHHHRCKQAEGWWLEQPEPGVLVWHTPSGRSYATTPTEYPV